MFRDTTLEAVSDGLYVSPAIETADYHASLNKNSWFYVFDYQTKYGDYATVSLDKLKKGPNVAGNVLLSQLSFVFLPFISRGGEVL